MRIGINECVHCLVSYEYQYSGEYRMDHPREYNDIDYCPDCKKELYLTLAKIPKKFKYDFVITKEIDLDSLLRWEKEKIENHKKRINNGEILLPLCRRIFPTLYNSDRDEQERRGEVVSPYNDKIYRYQYWPSNKADYVITVRTKIKLC